MNEIALCIKLVVEGQTERLEISYYFDLDQISISFGNPLEVSCEAVVDSSLQNEAVKMLNDLIREAGCHRFHQITQNKIFEGTYYYNFACPQDEDNYRKSEAFGKRDRRRMERFHCDSNLVIKTDPAKFFSEIRRQRSCPFWVDPQFILCPQLRTVETETSAVIETESGSDTEESYYDPGEEEDEIEHEDKECEDPREQSERILLSLDKLKDLVQEQGTKLNIKWLDKFDQSNASNMTLLEGNDRLKRTREMPKTWARNRHPATLYRR